MHLLLETKNLTMQFKKEEVLKNVSVHVEENTVYGLLGPNGAGKSTLLKLITGVLQPTHGEIYFANRLFKRQDLAEMGAMIEGPAIYPNLTAYENLEVLCVLLKLPKTRIAEVLKVVALQNTDKKTAKHFSLGMKQRLGIAMALLNQPRLLILDEPTNGLDPLGIQELRELIRSFPAQGMTVILSSHILSEVQQVADHIGIIVEGQLGYEGKNAECGTNLEALFMEIVREKQGVQRS